MKKFSIRTSRLLAGAAVAAAALFAACTADTEDVPVRVPLRFAVSMPEGWDDPDAARSAVDKALPTRAESIADIESFGVFAYVESPRGEHALYLNNIKVNVTSETEDGDSYTCECEGGLYYLRGGMKTIFFAYAPYKNLGGKEEITYNVGENTLNMPEPNMEDLLIAGPVEVEEGVDPIVSLTFSHALSKVTFKVSGTETYSGFTLSNIATTGTLAPTFTDSNPKWSWSTSTPDDETMFSGTLGTGYFMIPQSLAGTEALEGDPTIELTGTDKTGTLTVDWKPNNQYTYTFDLSSTSSGGS